MKQTKKASRRSVGGSIFFDLVGGFSGYFHEVGCLGDQMGKVEDKPCLFHSFFFFWGGGGGDEDVC